MVLAATGRILRRDHREAPALDLAITCIMRAFPSVSIACKAPPAPAELLSRLITMLYRNGPITASHGDCRVPEAISLQHCLDWSW